MKYKKKSFRVSFFKDVKALVATIEALGNPFLEDSEDLLVLGTKEIAGAAMVTRLRQRPLEGMNVAPLLPSVSLIV